MDNQASIGTIYLYASGQVQVNLEGKQPFRLSTLAAIDLVESVREQSRLDQRRRDREKLRAARIDNVSYRATIGILQSEDE